MSSSVFMSYFQGTLNFLSTILTGLIGFLEANPWLFAMVLAPVIVALIIFGVGIVFNVVFRKNNDRKGER